MFLVVFLLLVELPARSVRGAHRLLRLLTGRRGPAPWEPWVYRTLGVVLLFALCLWLLAVTGS